MSAFFFRQSAFSVFLRVAALGFATAFCVAPAVSQSAPELEVRDLRAAAEQAIDADRPLAATRLLTPLLAKPGAKDPALLLLAARAAAGWEGWGTVVQLLGSQPWLDSLAFGEGRALLARARVERGLAPLDDARRAVRSARVDALGPRLVTLARSFDRANLLDSAAAAYLRAAEVFPALADWLRLRAAGVLADSARRSGLYATLSLPAAVPRIRWTEALARDRSGDWRGAAEQYDALGAALASLRLRLRGVTEPSERTTLRRELLAFLGRGRSSAADARDAIAMLDESFGTLTPEEQLLVARRALPLDPTRAVRGFQRAASRAKPLSDADQLSYATALQRLGRHHDAMQLFGAIRSREHRTDAQYLRARSLLASGSRTQGLALLEEISRTPLGDSATAATAGYLRADLLVDDGAENTARQAYLDVARRFPQTGHGARAAFQAALLAWVHGDRAAAAVEFEALAERANATTEGVAALYWSGRALQARGDTAAAAARWRNLLERFPNSYYTVPAAQRLGVPAVRAPAPDPPVASDSAVTAAFERAARLEELGLKVEARFEYDWLSRQAGSFGETSLLGVARAFAERGLVGQAYRMALRSPNAQSQRLTFPLPEPAVLEAARAAGVDPLLASALIRQESAFDPVARSRADARGLMQVLPSVGAGLAPSIGIHEWEVALLYQPEINAHFGVAHLKQNLERFPALPVALAVYNAGERPTNRWLGLPGAAEDLEVFIERIQYVETRDYVRRVLRNLAVYRAFYPPLTNP